MAISPNKKRWYTSMVKNNCGHRQGTTFNNRAAHWDQLVGRLKDRKEMDICVQFLSSGVSHLSASAPVLASQTDASSQPASTPSPTKNPPLEAIHCLTSLTHL